MKEYCIALRCMIYLFLVLALPLQLAQARWETREDANTEVQFFNRSIDLKEDGTYTEDVELKTIPTKEDGGENLATQPVFYDASASQLKVLKASTKFQGKEYEVLPDFIEDKPVASSVQGFHNINQVLIKFPHSKKGSELYLKYQIKLGQPVLPGYFATHAIYGQEGYWLASQMKVTSEIPLFVGKNDPEGFLEIKESQLDGKWLVEIQLKRPVMKRVTDELSPNLNYKNLPWVSISTQKTWSELAQKMVAQYEGLANQELPPLFQAIAAEASTKKDEIEKINTVTSQLAMHIKYKGDWRATYNHWFPRHLEDIAKDGQGDCKDFSLATTAILRKLGIQAHLAAVQRGEMKYETPVDSPNLFDFNHMIVKLKLKWIDPTNFDSYAQGVFPDIADRRALVFDPSSPGIQKVQPLKASDSHITVEEVQDLSRSGQLLKVGQVDFKGGAALFFTGVGLRASKDTVDHSLLRNLTDENRILQWKIEDYDLTSRKVVDLAFKYEITEKSSEIKTDIGPGYPIQPGYFAAALLMKTQNRVSDLFVGNPITIKRKTLLKNLSRVKKGFSGCTIKSQWINFSRRINDLKGIGIQILDEIEVKKGLILNGELMSQEFSQLQSQVETCFNGRTIIYKSKRSLK